MTTTINRSITTLAPAGPTTRSGRADVRALPAALRSEWIKFSTLRTNKVMLAASAGLGFAVAWALAATNTDPTLMASELFIYPMPLVATLSLITGILLFTAEAQHGTLAVTLIARPARWVTVAAKTTTAAGAGLVLGTTAMVAGFAGAALGGVELGSGAAMAPRALWALLYIVLAGVIGLAVGMIVRHGAGAISGLLMWSFVIENLFAPALANGARHLLPFSAGYRLLDAGSNFEPPVVINPELSRPAYALIFGAYAMVGLAIGSFLLYRRDTN